MSNIKKGSKLTVSTANGISRATTTSLGVLEVSGPKMSDVTNAYNSNPAHFVVGATDVSGILQVGINNDGNTFIDASVDNNHKDIILQKYGGNTIFGSGSNSTAKVGIGTTSPGAKLEVKGNNLNNAAIFIKSYDTTDKTFELRIRDDTTSSYPLHIGPINSFDGININNSNGNVGIGTMNPNERLHVIGNAVFQLPSSNSSYTSDSTHGINLIPYIDASGANAGGRIFFNEEINGNQNYGFTLGYNGGGDNAILNYDANTFNISRHTNSGNGLKVISIDRDTSEFNSNGVQIFSDHPTSSTDNNLGTILSFRSPFTDDIKEEGGFKFVMDDTIDTSTIYPRLSINAFQDTGSLWEISAITFKTTSSSYVNVGIGTTSPACLLEIRKDSLTTGGLGSTTVWTNNDESHLKITGDNNCMVFRVNTSFNNRNALIQVGHRDDSYHKGSLFLNPYGGNVGIGTTNASGGLLHVQGNIYSTGKILGEVGGSNLIVGGTTYQSATAPTNGMLVEGNVGIGTTNPQYPLHVSHGNIAVTSIAGSSPGVHLIRKANANSNSTYGGDDYIDWRMLNNGTLQLEGRVIVNSTTKTFSALCCRSDYEGGNVIIGHATSTPRGQLTIRSNVGAASTPNSASNAALFIGDSNNGLYLNMGTSTNGTTAAFGLNWKNSGGTNADVDNALVLRNYSGENRVGIGTMNPNYLGDNEPTPNSTNFPNLSKPGSGATAPIKLDVRGSIELSPEDPANPNTGACAPNIYFPANNSNALYASGLIWRNYHSTFLRDIKGGILFEPSKNGSDSGFAAGGLGFYTSYYNGSDSNYDNDNEVTATCKLTILGSGNVGIGTTNPITMLDISCNLNTTGINVKGAGVENNGKYQFILRAEGPDDSTQRVVHFLNSSTRTDDGGANTYTIRNDFGNLRLGNASYDTIIEGNVGIGTTTPKSGLQVFHDQGLTVSATQTTGERTAILRLGSPYDTNVGNIENYCAKITSTNNHSQNYGADLRFYTHPNGQSFTGSPFQTTERMRIRGDTGNIGIGVTNPSTMLQVQGQIHSYDKITGKSGGEFGVGTPTDYTFSVERKITPSDGAGSDNFGYSVSVYNNKMIVGATGNADKGASAGSAYIFDITTGAQLHKLYAGDAAVNDNFGFSVAISANYAIVGAPYSDQSPGANSGAAYIFDIRTGAQIYELTGSDLQGGAEFGWSVAIDNKHAAVGARKMDAGSADVGRIYVFELETGTQIMNTLMPPDDRAANDQLGYSVAIAGDYAAAGAVYDHHGNGPDSGAVYVFDIKSKTVVQALVPSDSASNDYFGSSVAMSGNYIIVGANGNDDVAVDSGSAYIFDVITGTQLHKLTANDPNTYDRFGSSVAISGNYAVVGAEYDDDGGNASGSAYVFDVRTGSLLKKIIASDDAADDLFGGSVSIDGNYIVVGSKFDDDNGSASGSAYVYGPAVLNPPTLNCNIPETVEINGNVGIGTSTPKSILNIVKKSKYPSEGEDTKMKLHRITWSDSKEAEKMFYRVYYGLRYSFFKHVNSQRLDGDIDPDGYAIMYKNKYNITEWLNGINVDISFNTYFTSFPYYNGASSSPSIFDAATVSFRAKQDCDFLLLSQSYAYHSYNFHGYAMVYDLYNNDYYTILFPHSDDTSSYQNGLSPAISLKAGRYYKLYFYTVLYRYPYYDGADYVYAWQTIPQSTLTSTTSPTAGYNLNSVHSNDISSNITEWFTYVNDSDYIEWLDEHDVSLKLGDSQCSFSINDPASTAPLSVAKEYFHDLSNNTIAEFKGTYPVKIKDDGYIESRGINNIRMTRELTKVSVTQWVDTTGSAPSGRYEHDTWLAHDRYIYVRGGYTSTYTYGLYRYDLSGGSWTSFGNTSFSAIYTADVYDHENDILYFFGGSYSGGYLNGLNKYTFGADGNYIGYTLSSDGASGNPLKRDAAKMVLYKNCLYMFGGRNGSTYYNDLWKFDLATNTWSELSTDGYSYAADRRSHHNMVVYNGFIYIQGGYNGSSNIDSTSSLYMYNIHRRSNDAWTKIQLSQSGYIPHWNHRYGTSTLVDNYMLIFNGVSKNQYSGTTEKNNNFMFIVDLDNHTVERRTVAHNMVHCYATHYSKKLGKFFTVLGYNSDINGLTPSGLIHEYTPYFSTVMKNNAEDMNAWIIRESPSFNTYSWIQFKSYVRKYSAVYHGEFGKYDLPTVQWCLAHSKELEYRSSIQDTWIPCYDENGEKAWIHLGTTNHSHLNLHYPYPGWGDSNSSSGFRRAVVMVCRDKRTTDLKIEANHLIVRGESSSKSRPQDALVITNYCSGQSGYLPSGTLDTNTKVTSMAILAAGENQLSAIYFGSNTQGRKFVARKTAIMCEGVHSYDRGKLHFCTQGTNHTDYQNVGISDSRMVIQHDGKVGIGTTSITTSYVQADIVGQCFRVQGYYTSGNTGSIGELYSGGARTRSGHAADISILATKAIYSSTSVYALSDYRIKREIEDVPDDEALRKLLDIECKYYKYKDYLSRGDEKTIGFIAQQVRDVFPMAVSLKEQIIPNVYVLCNNFTFTPDGNTFRFICDEIPAHAGRYKFICSDISNNGEHDIIIVRNEDNSFTFDKEWDNVFCFGYEVDDTHILDKQKLFALNFSATQELARIMDNVQTDLSNVNTTIQQQATTIQEQATTIQEQATKITTLETQIADILTRLSNLENTGSA